ncbi:MAG: hypothetical protein KAV18_05210 [Candidatus Omnitrophica bacterium]|nr:hypothetical protein [Candidatus Omnitrophota bacterium]
MKTVVKKIKNKKETLKGTEHKIEVSQKPLDLINRNFRHARFILNLQKLNKV